MAGARDSGATCAEASAAKARPTNVTKIRAMSFIPLVPAKAGTQMCLIEIFLILAGFPLSRERA
jgi:hypothetical protein